MSKTINHTWATELVAELKTVVKGFEEGRKYEKEQLPKVKELITNIESEADVDVQEVAHKLIDLKLNWFGSKLLSGQYQDQAELNNKTEPTIQPPVAGDSSESATASSK